MNTKPLLAILLTFGLLIARQSPAQSTSFNYQGRLNDAGAPANGTYAMQFGLFATSSGGSPLGSTNTYSALTVSNGLFTVNLDFGSGIFNGQDCYLEISVGATTLQPRVRIASTPVAIYANSAGSATNVTGIIDPAHGGTGAASVSAARVALGGVIYNGDTASIGNGNFGTPNFSNIIGDAAGQMYMSKYGQLWHWDGAKWLSGLQLAGPIDCFSTVGESQLIVGDPANTIDNVLALQNTNSQHFSAARFLDRFGNEQGAIGYGNDAAAIFRTNLFWERYYNYTPMGFAGALASGGRGLYGGVTEAKNDFVWYDNAGYPGGNVIFRINSTTRNVEVTNNIVSEGQLRVGAGATGGGGMVLNRANGQIIPEAIDDTSDPSGRLYTTQVRFPNGSTNTAANPNILLNAGGTGIDGNGYNLNLNVGRTNKMQFDSGGGFARFPSAFQLGIGETPNACAVLDIASATQGVLLPRMTKAQRDNIVSKAAGLAIYQIDNTPGLRVFNGTDWVRYNETTDP
jgi:hypothetical protein